MNRILLPLTISVLVLVSLAQEKPAGSSTRPTDDSQLYRNSTFAFRYHIPFGWVDRTKDLQEQDDQNEDAASSNVSKKDEPGQVLLAVFERPPQAPGDTVNSAVVIASESAASYPGLKSAEDYLGPLSELTTSKGFKGDGDPQEVTIDARSLIRADYSKALNDKLTMYQSTLVMLDKKRIVSFTFIAGSKDEIDDLIDNLNFESKSGRSHK